MTRQKWKIFNKASLELSEQDGDWDSFPLAIRNVAEARGGITKLAKKPI